MELSETNPQHIPEKPKKKKKYKANKILENNSTLIMCKKKNC